MNNIYNIKYRGIILFIRVIYNNYNVFGSLNLIFTLFFLLCITSIIQTFMGEVNIIFSNFFSLSLPPFFPVE